MRTIQARPTTYNGIPMRSRLEARYAAVLDAHGLSWVYEPRAFANERGQYLPDFYLPGADDVPALFIEVRPTVELGMLALSQMPVIWDSEPRADLMVTMPLVPFRYQAGPLTGAKWMVFGVEPWS